MLEVRGERRDETKRKTGREGKAGGQFALGRTRLMGKVSEGRTETVFHEQCPQADHLSGNEATSSHSSTLVPELQAETYSRAASLDLDQVKHPLL